MAAGPPAGLWSAVSAHSSPLYRRRILTSVTDPLSGFFAIDRDRCEPCRTICPASRSAWKYWPTAANPYGFWRFPSHLSTVHGTSKMNFGIFTGISRPAESAFFKAAYLPEFPPFSLPGMSRRNLRLHPFLASTRGNIPRNQPYGKPITGHAHLLSDRPIRQENYMRLLDGGYRNFVVVVFLGLFLRGGQLASPAAIGEWSSLVLPFIIGATSCLIWLSAIVASRIEVLRPRVCQLDNLRFPSDRIHPSAAPALSRQFRSYPGRSLLLELCSASGRWLS